MANGRRHGLILPVMLLIIALLAILSASFAFQVRAHQAANNANHQRMQLRLAADAGIQHALLLLRENRHDATLWYDNDELFHNRSVWSMLGDHADLEVPEEIDPDSHTYRFSLVADDPLNDVSGVRYGLTDESSKLNINFASPEQLATLFQQVLPEETDVAALVEALVDWRDADNDLSGEGGAEAEYYAAQNPPYQVKNNPFETVEELLLVKGFTAQIVFGEDADRNGLLTPNEDDGVELFPPDNEDGLLDRGIYPYLTVWSRDLNRSADNITRIDLNMRDTRALETQLSEYFDTEFVNYIVAARRAGTTFTTPVQLLDFSFSAENNANNNNDNSSNDIVDNPDPFGIGATDNNDNGVGRRRNQQNPGQPAGVPSPFTVMDLPQLCDYTTTSRQPAILGAININTAPREVLRCLVNGTFTVDDVEAIVAARVDLTPLDMETVAWPVVYDVISQEALESIYAQITSRSQQFHIESLGYADHFGMMVRLQAVIELRGHVPQYVYYRDISELGVSYPVRGSREEASAVRNRR